MSIIRVEMDFPKENPMQWITFDSETSRMIDCPLPIESIDRTLVEALYFRLDHENKFWVAGSDKSSEVVYKTKSIEIVKDT